MDKGLQQFLKEIQMANKIYKKNAENHYPSNGNQNHNEVTITPVRIQLKSKHRVPKAAVGRVEYSHTTSGNATWFSYCAKQ